MSLRSKNSEDISNENHIMNNTSTQFFWGVRCSTCCFSRWTLSGLVIKRVYRSARWENRFKFFIVCSWWVTIDYNGNYGNCVREPNVSYFSRELPERFYSSSFLCFSTFFFLNVFHIALPLTEAQKTERIECTSNKERERERARSSSVAGGMSF